LPNSVEVTSRGFGTVGISNPGWWGISVEQANTYTGSFYASGKYVGFFTASLVSDITNETLASTKVLSLSAADCWTKHEFELKPFKDASNSNNSFVLSYESYGETVLNFNLISLFPPTYKNT
jgi:alpha-L-arabinofuranosidase